MKKKSLLMMTWQFKLKTPVRNRLIRLLILNNFIRDLSIKFSDIFVGSRTDDLSQLSVLTAPNSEVLDTAKICGKVLGLLQENKIPVAQFALHALKRSQGRASEILNKPKAYEKLSEEGREPYKKIKKWLDQKDPIADIGGKMQGKNIFVTLQELFIVTQVNFRKFQILNIFYILCIHKA